MKAADFRGLENRLSVARAGKRVLSAPGGKPVSALTPPAEAMALYKPLPRKPERKYTAAQLLDKERGSR